MNKFLLSCIVNLFAVLNVQYVKAQGVTCAEATAMPMIVMATGDNVYWYSTTASNDQLFPSSTPAGIVDGDIQVFEDCDGTKAIKVGSNSYYLESGKEYKVRLKTHENQMWMLSGVPTANAPEGMYCFKPKSMPTMVMATGDNVYWYSTTASNDQLFPSSTPAGIEDGDIQVFEDCRGNEATKINPNSYYLESGKEYLVRLKTHENQMWMLTGVPTANAPEGMYCFKPKSATMGINQTQNPNTTVWYSLPIPYPAPVVVTALTTDNPISHNEGIVTKVVTKQDDCNGVINESNELIPNRAYAKTGTGLISVTVSDVESSGIRFTLDAMSATGCQNGPTHITSITLDSENTYPNAAWTLYRQYVVAEDGTYTITNHGAEGTVMRVGKLIENSCDFETTPLEAIVDENNEASVVGEFKVGDIIIIESDAFDILKDSTPYLKIEKGGTTGIRHTQKSSRLISVFENPNNGSFIVKSYLLNNGATIAVYDLAARKIFSTIVPAGTEEQQVNLNVSAGQYLIVVYGKSRSASAHVIIR